MAKHFKNIETVMDDPGSDHEPIVVNNCHYPWVVDATYHSGITERVGFFESRAVAMDNARGDACSYRIEHRPCCSNVGQTTDF